MAMVRRRLCPTAVLVATAVVALYATAAASSSPDDDPGMPMAVRHQCWMARVGRTYADAGEKARRFEVFRANAERIDSANRAGNLSYTLGLTPFADLTADEFRARHLMPDQEPAPARALIEEDARAKKQHLPKGPPPAAWGSMDWRTLGAVTDVKDQDQNKCKSCWAFAAVAATEGLLQNITGKLTSLSAQQVLDCSGANSTCEGGHIIDALRYIAGAGVGLSTESGYGPYVGVKGACGTSTSIGAVAAAAVVRGVQKVRPHDKDALQAAVMKQPVAADMYSDDPHFKYYKAGVYRGTSGCGKKRNHAVAVVGFGTDSDGTKYWLLKNSWGKFWGEGGYMRIAVDADCGVSDRPAYPFY